MSFAAKSLNRLKAGARLPAGCLLLAAALVLACGDPGASKGRGTASAGNPGSKDVALSLTAPTALGADVTLDLRVQGTAGYSQEDWIDELSPVFASLLKDQEAWFEEHRIQLLTAQLEKTYCTSKAVDPCPLAFLQVTGLAFPGRAPWTEDSPATPHVLWIALDGVDWNVAEPLLKQGEMPVLAGLKQEGAWGDLQTIHPILSPVIWTSMATGTEPEQHGILDFLALDPSTGNMVPVTGNLRKTAALWEILGRQGFRAGVIGWWATYPAEAVKGYMVSDRVAPLLNADKTDLEVERLKTHPPRIITEVEPLFVGPDNLQALNPGELIPLLDVQTTRIKGEKKRLEDLLNILVQEQNTLAMAHHLFASYPADLEIVYLEAPDAVSHLYMPFASGSSPFARGNIWYKDTVPSYYRRMDHYLGELLARHRHDDTIVLITSDHGFRFGTGQAVDTDSRIGQGTAADWHREQGVLVVAGPGIKPGKIEGAGILDIAPTVLHWFGIPPAKNFRGRLLTDLLTDPPPPGTEVTGPDAYERLQTAVPVSSEEDAEVIRRLQALGYLQADTPVANIVQAKALLESKRYREAEQAFRKILPENRSSRTLVLLARALYPQGKTAEARSLFDEAAALKVPRLALVERARFEQHLGNHEAALADIALAKKAKGSISLAEVYLAEAELHLARGADKRAMEALEQGLALDPDNKDLRTLKTRLSK